MGNSLSCGAVTHRGPDDAPSEFPRNFNSRERGDGSKGMGDGSRDVSRHGSGAGSEMDLNNLELTTGLDRPAKPVVLDDDIKEDASPESDSDGQGELAKRKPRHSLLSMLLNGACSGPGACGGGVSSGDTDQPLRKTGSLYPDAGRPTIRTLSTAKGLKIRTYAWRITNPRGLVLLVHSYGGHSLFDWLHHDPVRPTKVPSYKGSWVQQLNLAGFSVYALDLQGHGFSTSWNGKRCNVDDFDDFAEDVIQVIQEHVNPDNYRQRPIFLMGLSMGGCICARAAEMLCQKAPLIHPNFMRFDDNEIADVQRVFKGVTPEMAQKTKMKALAAPHHVDSAFGAGIEDILLRFSEIEREPPPNINVPGAATMPEKRQAVEERSILEGKEISSDLMPNQVPSSDRRASVHSNPSTAALTDKENLKRVSPEKRDGASLGFQKLCGCGNASPPDPKSEPIKPLPLAGLVLIAPMLGLNKHAQEQPALSTALPLLGSLLPNCPVAEGPTNEKVPAVQEMIESDPLTFKGLVRARMAKEMLGGIQTVHAGAPWLRMVVGEQAESRGVTSMASTTEDESAATFSDTHAGVAYSMKEMDCGGTTLSHEEPQPPFQLSMLIVSSTNDDVVDTEGSENFFKAICGGQPTVPTPLPDGKAPPPILEVSGSGTLSLPYYNPPPVVVLEESVAHGFSSPGCRTFREEGAARGEDIMGRWGTKDSSAIGVSESTPASSHSRATFHAFGSGTTTTAASLSGSPYPTQRRVFQTGKGFRTILKAGGESNNEVRETRLRPSGTGRVKEVRETCGIDDDESMSGLVASVGDEDLVTTTAYEADLEDLLVDERGREEDEREAEAPAVSLCGGSSACAGKAEFHETFPPMRNRQLWLLNGMGHWMNKEEGNAKLASDVIGKWLLPRALDAEM